MPPPAKPDQTSEPAQAAAGNTLQRLRYLAQTPIRVQGLATGRRYEFSESKPVDDVDIRDVPALLRTRYFQRA